MNPEAHWVQYPKEGSCRSIPPPPAHALKGEKRTALEVGGLWHCLAGCSLAPPLHHLYST